jgi:pimeloyl-ACP methyl ester carboxylesterase/tetratricopeptide (TPR) repeat protein
MSITVLVPGVSRGVSGSARRGASDLATAWMASHEIVVEASRGASGSVETIELPDTHLIEVELDNGLVLFRHLDTLEGMDGNASRSGRGGALLPTHIDLPDEWARGGVRGMAVRLYRFFTGAEVAKATVKLAAGAVEARLMSAGADALFRIGRDGSCAPAAGLQEGQRMAVLIHGTFSSTLGSFGDLVPLPDMSAGDGAAGAPTEPRQWERLAEAFADPQGPATPHVYGFEHCTLTKSPVENAIALLKVLPRRAELTLLTHSRGGLVGDLIARAGRAGAAIDDRDFAIFDGARTGADPATKALRSRERDALRELAALLADRQPRIERFVRVASPSRGTILASDRLDRGLSIAFNLMRLIPGPQRALLEPVRQLARSVAAQRADATALPGLEAMRATSPVIAMLNRPDVVVDGPLAIVAGDAAPRGVLRSLAVLATDLFYREDHDIVVETASMSAGIRRQGPVHRLDVSGAEVDHFSYFRGPATSPAIVRALTDAADTAGFRQVRAESVPDDFGDARGGGTERAPGTRPVAILLPGIQGSQLGEASGNIVWLDLLEMSFGGIRKIGAKGGVPTRDVRSVRSIPRYYGALLRHLGKTHDVIDFHYDWRQSVATEADRLARALKEVLDSTEGTKQPIRLVGHSMGGLVVRAMIARHRALWDRMFDGREGSRFVMLGTPNGGSVSAAWALLGRDRLVRMLATVDVVTTMPQLLEEIQPMPGALELLPTDGGGAYFKRETWTARNVDGYPLPDQGALDAAKRTVSSLTHLPEDGERMVYLAGKADLTPVAIDVVGSGGSRRLRLLATRNGDGRVPWRTAELDKVRTWYAPTTAHGDLCRDEGLLPAIHDLVTKGKTTLLSRTPPTSRGDEQLVEVTPDELLYPTEAEFEAAAVGADPTRRDAVGTPDRTATRVGIRHGDVRSHDGIIALGHYRDTPLLSAELAIDLVLDRQLLRHRDLGLYPGPINSSELFLRSAPGLGPDGALIVGLGVFGELSKARLVSTLSQAFMRYALHPMTAAGTGPCKLTTLLIGHRESRLSIRDCVVALLEALRGANRDLPKQLRIDEVEVIELYEDVAIAAAEALDSEMRTNAWDGEIVVDPVVRAGVAGRSRAQDAENGAWDQKVRITLDHEDNSRFRYEVLSQSALISQADVTIDRATIDGYIRNETGSTNAGTSAGKLLFEWMVPRSMKTMAADGRALTLMLDATTAGYPWELMEDHFDNRDVLIAVDAGIMRQLVDRPFPDRPPLARTDRICIIGDPESYFTRLKSAKEEAEAVHAKFLAAGWSGDTTALVGGNALGIDEAIDLERNRVLHFAGHGVQDWGPEHLTGLVIGKNRIFGPNRVAQMRYAPEFVFLNCCHVGNAYDALPPEAAVKTSRDSAPHEARRSRAEFAANMAVAFVSIGTKAVIAAGWEVDDPAAKAFADEFYTAFLEGQVFAEAVRRGRAAAHTAAPDKNTWGAYQCYGDPDFRLRRASVPVDARPPGRRYKTPGQITSALNSLRADSRYAATREVRDLLDSRLAEVEELLECRPEWQDEAELFEAMGRCAAQLGKTVKAVGYFEAALRCARPGYSQEMLDRLWELRARIASARRIDLEQRGDSSDLRAACAQERKALKDTEAYLVSSLELAGAAGSWCRHVQLGDTRLRLAAVLTGRARMDMIAKAHAAYRQAGLYTRERHASVSGHARIRMAFAEFLLGGASTLTEDSASVIKSVLADLRETADAAPVYENTRLLAEAQLFDLLDGGLAGDSTQTMIVEAFNAMFLSGASPGQRLETLGDLQTVASLLRSRAPAVADRVMRILGDLKSAGDAPADAGDPSQVGNFSELERTEA